MGPVKKHRPVWIPVVAGLLVSNGKVLVGRRPEEKSLPGVWEFPGGKIELGEQPEVALARELKEELGIDAQVGRISLTTTFKYGGVGILLLFFEVPYWKGEPRPQHHSELKWVSFDELKLLDLPEANRQALPYLCESLS